MKKILVASLLFIFSFSNTFAYTPTNKDEKTLNNLYKQVDVLSEKKPEQVEKLYEKVLKIIPSLKKDDKNKYLITSLWDYLSTKVKKERIEETSSWITEYQVLEVIDWDTIKIKYNWKEINIRMIWIDSPENSTTRFWYVEKYWDQAKEKLKELIWNNKVTIELDETQWEYDKYSRLLAYVFVSWISLNQKMIELWYAKEYTYNKAYKYQKDFKTAQKSAELNKIWIWKESSEENNTNTWSTEEKTTTSNKIYITWSEGWCYYLNSNGNKSYVDKSYCWIIETNTNNSSSNTSSDRNYYTWPKWWCYYYNSKWNKTYVDRSLCK